MNVDTSRQPIGHGENEEHVTGTEDDEACHLLHFDGNVAGRLDQLAIRGVHKRTDAAI